MTDQNPSDALTKRPKIVRNALIGVGIVAALAGGGYAAYAVTTAVDQDVPEVRETASPEPTIEPADEPENINPTAYYVVSAVSGLTLEFDGTGSTDTDGTVTGFAWDFGDGTTGSGAVATHAFAAEGSYTVTLTVTDDAGGTAAFPAVIDVTAPAAPPSSGGYTYGNYPPGATMPNIPGTNQPDTSACASSTGTSDANGNPVCA